MLTTCLTLLAITLSPGTIVSIPRETPLVDAGRLNWVLRDSPTVAPTGTRGIVTRVAPEGTEGVVEVRVFDGTDRLYWLDEVGLVTPSPEVAGRRATNPTPAARLSPRSSTTEVKSGRRPTSRLRFAQVDATTDRLIQAALAAQPTSSCSGATMPEASMPDACCTPTAGF